MDPIPMEEVSGKDLLLVAKYGVFSASYENYLNSVAVPYTQTLTVDNYPDMPDFQVDLGCGFTQTVDYGYPYAVPFTQTIGTIDEDWSFSATSQIPNFSNSSLEVYNDGSAWLISGDFSVNGSMPDTIDFGGLDFSYNSFADRPWWYAQTYEMYDNGLYSQERLADWSMALMGDSGEIYTLTNSLSGTLTAPIGSEERSVFLEDQWTCDGETMVDLQRVPFPDATVPENAAPIVGISVPGEMDPDWAFSTTYTSDPSGVWYYDQIVTHNQLGDAVTWTLGYDDPLGDGVLVDLSLEGADGMLEAWSFGYDPTMTQRIDDIFLLPGLDRAVTETYSLGYVQPPPAYAGYLSNVTRMDSQYTETIYTGSLDPLADEYMGSYATSTSMTTYKQDGITPEFIVSNGGQGAFYLTGGGSTPYGHVYFSDYGPMFHCYCRDSKGALVATTGLNMTWVGSYPDSQMSSLTLVGNGQNGMPRDMVRILPNYAQGVYQVYYDEFGLPTFTLDCATLGYSKPFQRPAGNQKSNRYLPYLTSEMTVFHGAFGDFFPHVGSYTSQAPPQDVTTNAFVIH